MWLPLAAFRKLVHDRTYYRWPRNNGNNTTSAEDTHNNVTQSVILLLSQNDNYQRAIPLKPIVSLLTVARIVPKINLLKIYETLKAERWEGSLSSYKMQDDKDITIPHDYHDVEWNVFCLYMQFTSDYRIGI